MPIRLDLRQVRPRRHCVNLAGPRSDVVAKLANTESEETNSADGHTAALNYLAHRHRFLRTSTVSHSKSGSPKSESAGST